MTIIFSWFIVNKGSKIDDAHNWLRELLDKTYTIDWGYVNKVHWYSEQDMQFWNGVQYQRIDPPKFFTHLCLNGY